MCLSSAGGIYFGILNGVASVMLLCVCFSAGFYCCYRSLSASCRCKKDERHTTKHLQCSSSSDKHTYNGSLMMVYDNVCNFWSSAASIVCLTPGINSVFGLESDSSGTTRDCVWNMVMVVKVFRKKTCRQGDRISPNQICVSVSGDCLWIVIQVGRCSSYKCFKKTLKKHD